MKEEFNLSDKAIEDAGIPLFHFDDVKEFIKKLKEELRKEQENWTNGDGATLISDLVIDKLAGERLK
jgi:hypothetical protein